MALRCTTSARSHAVQHSSPFFNLPAELRIAIYDLLDYPPIDNEQCRGLILSCHQAKNECDEILVRKTKEWLATFKQTTLSQCDCTIRLLLPPPTPIGPRFRLNTIRELTIVFPVKMLFEFDNPGASSQFYPNIRRLNPIFALWLDKLTLRFAATAADFSQPPMKMWLWLIFKKFFPILQGGFTYAHDPVGQAQERRKPPFLVRWGLWEPGPAFMRKLVLSWALADGDMILVQGTCTKCPTSECMRSRSYQVISEDGCHGEIMKESSYRFRPSEKEHNMARPSSEHEAVCFKCGGKDWGYRRYVRALPEEDDDCWI